MSIDFKNLPLPPNWEQGFDPQSERNYYIDHSNERTTWVDPRIEYYKNMKENAASRNRSTSNQLSPQMVNKKPVADQTLQASTSNQFTTNELLVRQKKVDEIQQKFPQVPKAKILEILEANFGNISSTESIIQREIQLKAMEERNQKTKEEAKKKAEIEKEHLKENALKEKVKTGEKLQNSNLLRISDKILWDSNSASVSNQSSSSEAANRQNKIDKIHQKFPQVSKAKILEVLEANFGNASSTESIIQREIHLKAFEERNQKTKEEAKKKTEMEKDKLKENTLKEQGISDTETSAVKIGDISLSKTANTNSLRTSENIIRDSNAKGSTQRNLGPNPLFSRGPDPKNTSGPNVALLATNREKLSQGANPAYRCGPQIQITNKI